MDPLRHLAESDSFFTRAAAIECGVSERAIAALVRARTWFRIRRGYYTHTDLWHALTAQQRHLVTSRVVLHSLGDRAALSHVSALIAHGVATWGMDLSKVHVTRLDDGAGRIERDLVHHHGRVPDQDLCEADGLRTVSVARALVEAGCTTTGESALASFDSALFQGLSTHEELLERHHSMRRWPGTQHLHIPVRMASANAQSVGESRGFWLFRCASIPAPLQQFEVYDAGRLIGTTDWAWPDHQQLGEFDGEVKYTRLVPAGQTPGDVVFAEKQREDRLRATTGMGMVRLVWSDYDQPRATAARLRRALRIAG